MVTIPEELTNEILRYVFRIYPADVFTESHDKPHEPDHRARRPKRLLLVCKQWHRIGTPCLYETVEITCDEDMKRLANTLQSSSAPRGKLASMVRNLRIDGGYGRDLLTVAKLANNVRVLSVQLRTFSKYPTGGLARALACLNPVEVYLHGLGQRHETKKAESNTQILLRAIPGWTALRKISFLHIGWRPLTLPSELLTTLSFIPNLHIAGDRGAIGDLLKSLPFHALVRKASVQTITCYGADRCLRRNLKAFRDIIPEDVSGLLVYEETQRVLNDRAFHEAMEEMDKDNDLRARIGLPPYEPPPVRDSEDSDTDSLLGYL